MGWCSCRFTPGLWKSLLALWGLSWRCSVQCSSCNCPYYGIALFVTEAGPLANILVHKRHMTGFEFKKADSEEFNIWRDSTGSQILRNEVVRLLIIAKRWLPEERKFLAVGSLNGDLLGHLPDYGQRDPSIWKWALSLTTSFSIVVSDCSRLPAFSYQIYNGGSLPVSCVIKVIVWYLVSDRLAVVVFISIAASLI